MPDTRLAVTHSEKEVAEANISKYYVLWVVEETVVDVLKYLGFLVIPFDWGRRKRRSWSWGFES
jgi:hypothetical protein